MRAAIFDIDGTLADATHRLHHVTGSNRNWDAFFQEAAHDTPHIAICELFEMVRRYVYERFDRGGVGTLAIAYEKGRVA
jgi:phosphoglycolate phosphatase-like HAD superfamily hydrolase